MAISDWPVNERPREKLLLKGAASLSDAELLALFLRTGTRQVTAVDLARAMLREFGGLRGTLGASQSRFCARPGLGVTQYAQLQAVRELAQRSLQEKLVRVDAFANSGVTRRFIQSRLADRTREVFMVLFLDNRHRLIAEEELFLGTIDGATVHPREVVRRALFHNAAALILAHNHPSGVCEPSQADISITRRLKRLLEEVDIRTLDHLIVGEAEVQSLAEQGLM
ncbi:MAG: RadC family protein [Pseudohongiellaceae bacterium]|jgi:DNA repair protein RadC